MRRRRAGGNLGRMRKVLLPAWLLLLVLAPAPGVAEEKKEEEEPTGASARADVDASLYGETGRVVVRLAFTATKPLEKRYRVLLHLVRLDTGVPADEADHVPIVPTDRWEPGKPVSYPITTAIDPDPDGRRPGLVILVGLVDPTLDNGWHGRLEMNGAEPYFDRRYEVGRVPASSGPATVEQLRAAAKGRAAAGENAAAFKLLEAAYVRATDLATKLAVTGELLRLPPADGDPVTGPEQVRMDGLVAAEKLRWLGDRASALLRQKELRLALRVMERIGGVAEEERNTKVVGEPTAEARAKKDIVDVRSRLLRDLSDEELAEYKKLLEKADDDPDEMLDLAKKEVKRDRLVIARRLLLEARLHRDATDGMKEEIGKILEEIEERIVHDLTPEEEKRLEKESDHPSFHRLAAVPTARFVFLGPKGLVESIPRSASHRLDVASVLLTDLYGRSPVRPGERIVVYFKETYSGPATGGGSVITVGDAKPDQRGTDVGTALYFHELTHCVDDLRPVHDYKRGLHEGVANVGAIFVEDMFAGERGRFEALSRGGRDALKRHHLDRENAWWLIPAYAPSEGMLTEILARHAPFPGDHVDWTKLAEAYRFYRQDDAKTERTHRIMAHLGYALARAMGPAVWDTLAEFRFPVDRTTGLEMEALLGGDEDDLRQCARRGDVSGLLALAEREEPRFVANRARFAALAILDATNRGESAEADAVRRRLGVIRKMRVIGPFYPDGGPGLATIFPPEEEIDFAKEYVTPQGIAKWLVPERDASHFARIDGRGVVELRYGYPADAVTYALAHVNVDEATDALAYLGMDDEAALWVNGRHVQRRQGHRGVEPDYERWPVRLEKGRNRIFLKVANHGGGTGFVLRLVRSDGTPIPGMTTDLDPPAAAAAGAEPKWEPAFQDVYRRRSLGRKYEVVAGRFEIRNKALRGEADARRPGWRPFSVAPGFPQDVPAALMWLEAPREPPPADFLWRVELEEEKVPKLVLTWDGEGDELPLSGWSLVLDPHGKAFRARIERYDYLHYFRDLPAPEKWESPTVEVRRVDGLVSVRIGGVPVFPEVSCPPLGNRRFGLAVWGKDPALTGMALAHPRR